MTPDEIEKLARRDGVTTETIKTRIRRYGEQGARDFKPMSMRQRGRKGKSRSPWVGFKLPGSPGQ